MILFHICFHFASDDLFASDVLLHQMTSVVWIDITAFAQIVCSSILDPVLSY